jgi:3-oxoacyl-[acyl-carrier protein] reductase
MNRIDLAGRSAIVTGGAGGLGRAIVARLRQSGARVAIFDRPGRDGSGADIEIAGDVTDRASVEAGMDKVMEAFGRIDILVNNAGIAGSESPVAATAPDEWRAVLDINLTGAFLCCRAAIPHMARNGYGRIVNMGSLRAKEAPALSAAYAASKAGLMALTRTLAKEVAGDGILVTCVSPTAIDAGMSDGDDAERVAIVARIPQGRYGRADEVAAMVAFVASEECSFSTGAVFDISGGRASW